MTHVKITSQRGCASIIVDGVDLSRTVLAENFAVSVSTDPEAPSTVSLTLAPDILDLDLPEAAIAPLIHAASGTVA